MGQMTTLMMEAQTAVIADASARALTVTAATAMNAAVTAP